MKTEKTNIERYIKKVKLQIIKQEMECIPVKLMINENEDLVLMSYMTKVRSSIAAQFIRNRY